MSSNDAFYAVLRLALSVISVVAWVLILVKSVPAVKRAVTFERRLRYVTIVFLLTLLAALLGLTALYDWDRPPPEDPVLAVIGVAIRAVLAIGGVLILWTWPKE